MGYTNKDRRLVRVTRAEKRQVMRMRRLALKRELRDEPVGKQAGRARRRGWWFA